MSVMNQGLEKMAKSFGFGLSGATARYVALGIGTTNADGTDTLTNLDSEIIDSGLDRVAATITSETTTTTGDTMQAYYQWTATGSKTVSEAGVFSGAAANDGTMLARKRFASTYAVQSGYTFTLTYKIVLA